jgi:hypothetical protein
MKTTVFPPDEGFNYFDASPAQVASRVSSLAIAAQLIITGDSLVDNRLAETVYVDLLDLSAWLARRLANFHDDLDRSTWSSG